MPELPEVQTTVSGLEEILGVLHFQDVWTSYGSTYYRGKNNIKDHAFFKNFRKIVAGSKVTKIERRAKHILIHLNNHHTIVAHLKMTGHFLYGKYIQKNQKNKGGQNMDGRKIEWAPDTNPKIKDQPVGLHDPYNKFIRLVFILKNGKHLALSDMRKFATIELYKTSELELQRKFIMLGPEPLHKDFNPNKLAERLKKKDHLPIKQVLMDQSIVSGIGNIYSDEILWQSDIHPKSLPKKLNKEDIKKIFEAAQEILKRSIKLGGDSMSDFRNIKGQKGGFHPYHNAYRRHGQKCTKNLAGKICPGTIERIVITGRSAHFCNTHQTLKK